MDKLFPLRKQVLQASTQPPEMGRQIRSSFLKESCEDDDDDEDNKLVLVQAVTLAIHVECLLLTLPLSFGGLNKIGKDKLRTWLVASHRLHEIAGIY